MEHSLKRPVKLLAHPVSLWVICSGAVDPDPPAVSHGKLKLCNELTRETQFVKSALDTTAAVVDAKGTTSGHWVVQSTTVKRCMKPCSCFILVSHCVDAGKIYI